MSEQREIDGGTIVASGREWAACAMCQKEAAFYVVFAGDLIIRACQRCADNHVRGSRE